MHWDPKRFEKQDPGIMESAPLFSHVAFVFARFQLHVENHKKNPLGTKLDPGIQKLTGQQNS